ncbi:hypothetical protein P152DRAFT_459441 [Eremomyces bilateralis CBS 781.70]|uniref:Lytic polysaccharide monooxygenase n=1 Tax=Eremomyces bilateralis CBS 781.70 TaxID=1392243 RepID=A0A6G1G0D4_9PEZI|nr:uncharacterized protein P152DRAFT_459441 [Eremomyces bilateralis CBS 781.70]KAF1811503.1 hypothetical protein P152DRAFT_459441 [Eremomyces bilateralis CBS 781.70]
MKNLLILLPSLLAYVEAHMHLDYPPSLNAANNPFTEGAGDPHPDYPYNCCGMKHEYPCKGQLKLLGTPAGRAVATWKPGSTQHWNMTGQSNHYGGSCQIGFSVDKGKTFRVVKSYEGSCPHRNEDDDQNFDFVVPTDLPAGDVLFAWSWTNREQELNMNCAAISIESDSGEGAPLPSTSQALEPQPTAPASPVLSQPEDPPAQSLPSKPLASQPPTSEPPTSEGEGPHYEMDGCTCNCEGGTSDTSDGGILLSSCYCYCSEMPPVRGREPRTRPRTKHHWKRAGTTVAFSNRPEMLAVNVGNGCTSPRENAELKYPNPGPDVVEGDGEYPLELPQGNCV